MVSPFSVRSPGLIASAIFVFLESLDEFTGTYFVGVPDVTTLPLLMFNATMGGNYQISSITALLLLIPSIGFMLVVERFLKSDVLATYQTVAGLRKMRHRGLPKVDWQFTLAMAAYNLVRLPRLLSEAG